MSEKTVVLVGTLDTKGAEYKYLRDRLILGGVKTLLVDVGTLDPPLVEPDISRREVAAAAGVDLDALTSARDRGRAVSEMADAAAIVVRRLYDEGRCDGVIAAGGSGNTAIATKAMRALPVGVPKLMVSTMAAGNTRDYIGASDIALMASVTDVAGINSISGRILANAAAAMAGMVNAPPVELGKQRPLIAATMFGVTTPSVTAAREELEGLGYEVLTFHATGTGGRAMEALVESGFVTGVLDITTTELADELVGGVLSAGPDRLEMAGKLGVPQVVSQFESRNLYVHNPSVTLMRTTPAECAELGRQIARKLSAARGPVALFIPLRGVSAISGEGGPFFDAAADKALFGALRENVGKNVELHEIDANINDPGFAHAMAARLDELMKVRR
jgi:uncharacterized protein (UPF0261 family)